MSGAVLAIDVGSKRIGVAISEDPQLPAMPLATIQHASRSDDVRRIVALASERRARVIVVGYPLRLDGTRGIAVETIDRFIHALRAAFDGEVVPVDERMTTGAASKRLQQLGLSGSRRRALIDQLAAVEILESYRAARTLQRDLNDAR